VSDLAFSSHLKSEPVPSESLTFEVCHTKLQLIHKHVTRF
jgi:hypothetical protein